MSNWYLHFSMLCLATGNHKQFLLCNIHVFCTVTETSVVFIFTIWGNQLEAVLQTGYMLVDLRSIWTSLTVLTESSQLFDDGCQRAVCDTLQLIGHSVRQGSTTQVPGLDGSLHKRHAWPQLKHTHLWGERRAFYIRRYELIMVFL